MGSGGGGGAYQLASRILGAGGRLVGIGRLNRLGTAHSMGMPQSQARDIARAGSQNAPVGDIRRFHLELVAVHRLVHYCACASVGVVFAACV